MPKQIIILDKKSNGNIRVAFWLIIPNTRTSFFVKSDNISEWSGATAQEIQNIIDGKILEEIVEYGNDIDKNIAGAKTFLQNEFTKRQTRITNLNHWKFYGSFYDGTSWTNGGII